MTSRLKFGDANPADPTQTPSVLDPKHFSGIDNLKRTSLDSTQPKLLKKIVGPIKGVVLKRKDVPVGTSANKAPNNSWLSSLFGDSSMPDLPIYYVRIPEFHSHLPEPQDYANCEPSIAILYPEFICMKESPDNNANPGDLVWVDFIDRENFTDPIFIGKIENTPGQTPAVSAGNTSLQPQNGLNMSPPGGWSPSTSNGQYPEYDSSLSTSYNKNAQKNIYSREIIETAIKRKGYTWYGDGDFKINIVGVRNYSTGQSVTNKFDDILTISFKENGAWQYYEFQVTTDPGTTSVLQYDNVNGVARVIPGQYLNSHNIDRHKQSYFALKQKGNIAVFRDANRDLKYDETQKGQGAGINIHKAGNNSELVNSWSAGCQVFKRENDFNYFMSICYRSAKLNTNNFTYTLLESRDIT